MKKIALIVQLAAAAKSLLKDGCENNPAIHTAGLFPKAYIAIRPECFPVNGNRPQAPAKNPNEHKQ
jgi:hypothetical protein